MNALTDLFRPKPVVADSAAGAGSPGPEVAASPADAGEGQSAAERRERAGRMLDDADAHLRATVAAGVDTRTHDRIVAISAAIASCRRIVSQS